MEPRDDSTNAGPHELESEPIPQAADGLDQVSRRLSGTIDPEAPSRVPREGDLEGQVDPRESVEARLARLESERASATASSRR
ncbi:MAG: hypothetical protein JST54_26575 [Deltaproteobacteria bacterium]|nr:hypothetical protein [Deltaproteobacteria bacterium]